MQETLLKNGRQYRSHPVDTGTGIHFQHTVSENLLKLKHGTSEIFWQECNMNTGGSCLKFYHQILRLPSFTRAENPPTYPAQNSLRECSGSESV